MTGYFLSYSRADEAVALRLADDLIAAGVGLWVDQYDIRPSQHWDRAVEDAVHSCTGMIVVLSPRSAASPNVADEVSVAIERGKRVLPVVIETCTVPLRMTRMQFIDATTDYARALRKCLAEIARDDGAAPAPAPSPSPAAASPLDPNVVAVARQRLTALIGPIATVLVRNAAASAATERALYEALATKLPTPAERAAFLKSAPAAAAAVREPPPVPLELPAADVARIAATLARALGPIATHLVARERPAARSVADLCRRLAPLIPNDRERAAFLNDVARL